MRTRFYVEGADGRAVSGIRLRRPGVEGESAGADKEQSEPVGKGHVGNHLLRFLGHAQQ